MTHTAPMRTVMKDEPGNAGRPAVRTQCGLEVIEGTEGQVDDMDVGRWLPGGVGGARRRSPTPGTFPLLK
jgi:hypothetical protein